MNESIVVSFGFYDCEVAQCGARFRDKRKLFAHQWSEHKDELRRAFGHHQIVDQVNILQSSSFRASPTEEITCNLMPCLCLFCTSMEKEFSIKQLNNLDKQNFVADSSTLEPIAPVVPPPSPEMVKGKSPKVKEEEDAEESEEENNETQTLVSLKPVQPIVYEQPPELAYQSYQQESAASYQQQQQRESAYERYLDSSYCGHLAYHQQQSAFQPATYQQSSASYQNPSSTYQKPSSTYPQPSASYQQLSSSFQKPSVPYQKPYSSYQIPPASYQQPSTTYQTYAHAQQSMPYQPNLQPPIFRPAPIIYQRLIFPNPPQPYQPLYPLMLINSNSTTFPVSAQPVLGRPNQPNLPNQSHKPYQPNQPNQQNPSNLTPTLSKPEPMDLSYSTRCAPSSTTNPKPNPTNPKGNWTRKFETEEQRQKRVAKQQESNRKHYEKIKANKESWALHQAKQRFYHTKRKKQ